MTSCYHCGSEVASDVHINAKIDGSARDFCCFACQSVCLAIFQAGLQGYYQRTPEGALLGPPPEPPKDVEMYDFEEIQREYTKGSGDVRDIHLLVDGIHCAACVWLIERGLLREQGVLSAEASLAGKRVHLRWNNASTQLSTLLRALSRLGYSAVPFDRESAEGHLRRTNRALLYRVFFAGFAAMNMMWISIALYSGANRDEFRDFFHWMGLLLATPTLFYAGYPFYRGALGGLRARHLTMDLPIAIGLSFTYAYSFYVTIVETRNGEVYFDTVTNLTFVILVGRYLEGMFRQQAVSSTKRLMEMQPRVATVVRDAGEVLVPIRGVLPGDQVLIKPGYVVPVDGVVLSGRSAVVEAMLSGEAIPLEKREGDRVMAGTQNTTGALLVEVRATVQDNALSRIIRLVEEAQASKAPIQRVADRIVPWFVLVTLLCATFTFFLWQAVDFERALMAATSVLIITCPCALGMATPMSIAVASGLGARRGLLVKNGMVLETLSKVNHVVFDKTGTLTEGAMSLTRVASGHKVSQESLIRAAAAVERLSEHGIADAITRYAEKHGLQFRDIPVSDFLSTPGRGVAGVVDGQRLILGTASALVSQGVAMAEELLAHADEWERDAITCVHVACGGRHQGVFGIADKIREGAPALISTLRSEGIAVTLLSGDRQVVVQAVARQVGDIGIVAEVLPKDKDAEIKRLQDNGAVVAMVGDGVNDAPALIRSDVGIALGSGTDVSVDSADLVLMRGDLGKVYEALLLSRRTLRTIKQNIGLSFVYNAMMVPLAMSALVSPLVAAVTMPISSLVVIGNAGRISRMFKAIDRTRVDKE